MGIGSLIAVREFPPGVHGHELIDWVARNILPTVQKPGRYIASELWPAEASPFRGQGSVVLAFPDVYEIGAGNLGLSLLQYAMRKEPSIDVDRVYCPWPDMEQAMRSHGVPLYSLGSYTPCGDFDVVAVTIQHELSHTNILTLLDLSGIPILQKNRSEHEPYVIGGGPGICNPEPLAAFFDLFVIGDGEEVFPALVRLLVEARQSGRQRMEALRTAAGLEGVYAPSLYAPSYGENGAYRGLRPLYDDVPARIRPASIPSLDQERYPKHPSVPVIGMTHDRHTVEIMRGCPRGCRFCQAARYYSPLRLRPFDDIVRDAVSGSGESGWDDVSLLGLSCSDYPHIESLLARLNEALVPQRIAVSLPSLRADSFGGEVCRELGRSRTGGLTLAPEAGTERLRRLIGKRLTDDDLFRAVDCAFSHGWTSVKLYFMIGLPGEEPDDIQGIVSLTRSVVHIAKKHNARRVTVSCSPFVPKPHTPFEREPFAGVGYLRETLQFLRTRLRGKRLQFRWRDPEISRWETVFSRGDRRVAQGVLQAWRDGARFDEWDKQFTPSTWEAAFRCVEFVEDYGLRHIHKDQPLPWSQICMEAAAAGNRTSKEPKEPSQIVSTTYPPGGAESRIRVRVEFRKTHLLKFISHLDLVRLWRLLLRRAGVQVAYSEGKSPRPRLSFAPALPLGMEGLAEIMECWVNEPIPGDFVEILRAHAPAGLEIVRAKTIERPSQSIEALTRGADYSAEFVGWLCAALDGQDFDTVKLPGVESLERRSGHLFFSMRRDGTASIKPRAVVARLAGIEDEESVLIPMVRRGLWTEENGIRLPLFDASQVS